MPTLARIIDAIFTRAPKSLAMEHDNVGLQIGDPDAKIDCVIVALDATLELVAQAKKQHAQLALVHHPLFYVPPRNISFDVYNHQVIAAAIRAGVAIASMHTNLDFAPGGVNDRLAEVIGLTDIHPLRPWGNNSLVKLVVFVPQAEQERVRQAICAAGAGGIGNYGDCTFRAPGTGTFRPLAGAHPAIGKVGDLEQVAEERLEVLVEKGRLGRALEAMQAAHPYEEVAYDIIPLANSFPGAGEARLGKLKKSISAATFARRISRQLGALHTRITGSGAKSVEKVAVAAGSAKNSVEPARKAGAEVLVTGEIPHHERLEAQECGLCVIELGHAASERPAVWVLADWLEADFGTSMKVIRYD
jgi:dinuclear metal center YbgI/SA1388 family protein